MKLNFRNTKIAPKELSQYHTYELISFIIQNNPARKSPKAIAVDMQVDLSTVYRWGENPKTSGIELTFERLLKFAQVTHSENLVVQYIHARTKR